MHDTPVAPVLPAAEPTAASAPSSARTRRSWVRPLLMLSVPLLVVAVGGYVWLTGGKSVSTDNATVAQDKVSVSAEIGGNVVAVLVHENQPVKAGDLLFRLDPEPYRIALAQADAAIAAAQARVTTLQATADTTGGDITAAQEAVAFARSNLARERELMARGFNTRTRVEAAEHALAQADGDLADARAAATRADAALATGTIAPGINPGVLAAQVQRRQALYNLSRTEVRAPVDGIVSQSDRLQVGQTMIAGLPAVSIVRSSRSWIEANFKETDLARMRAGQRAEITLDACASAPLAGRVESLGAGTGSEFSVLPAQNATGNWVKVTQRVPVRIAITGTPRCPLIAGTSADVRVFFDEPRRAR